MSAKLKTSSDRWGESSELFIPSLFKRKCGHAIKIYDKAHKVFNINMFNCSKAISEDRNIEWNKAFWCLNKSIFCLGLWHGSRNEDRVSPEPKTSTSASMCALWPRSQQHPEGQWGSSCRTWCCSLQSCWDKWVQTKCRRRNAGSSTAWSWRREYENFARVKRWLCDGHDFDLNNAISDSHLIPKLISRDVWDYNNMNFDSKINSKIKLDSVLTLKSNQSNDYIIQI